MPSTERIIVTSEGVFTERIPMSNPNDRQVVVIERRVEEDGTLRIRYANGLEHRDDRPISELTHIERT